MSEGNGKTSIQVIERMMDLLDALARNNEPVNLKRLANSTGLHPSTAHRILNMMVEFRMVDRVEPGTYRLGIKLLELGNLVKSRINLRQEALPFMQRLHQELHETVNLSVRQGDEMVYVERLLSDRTAARARKDFRESDRIRDQLAAMGVVIKDSKDGTTWEIAR